MGNDFFDDSEQFDEIFKEIEDLFVEIGPILTADKYIRVHVNGCFTLNSNVIKSFNDYSTYNLFADKKNKIIKVNLYKSSHGKFDLYRSKGNSMRVNIAKAIGYLFGKSVGNNGLYSYARNQNTLLIDFSKKIK